MAYQINRTNGSILTTVPDGQIDNLSTDLTFVGKNYSGFGESINENFVKLLENFSDVNPPANPIKGQIWFDSSLLTLKVYNGIEFVPISSATVSNTVPLGIGSGDLWYDSVGKQLFLYDGTRLVLVGPEYSASQGISGFKVETIFDELNQARIITYLYVGGSVLGIFSKDTFTPKTLITGFPSELQAGFTAINNPDLKFVVTATNSEQLAGLSAAAYVRKDQPNIVLGEFSIQNDQGLTIGEEGKVNLLLTNGNLSIVNSNDSKTVSVSVRRNDVLETAMLVNSSLRQVDFYLEQDSSTVRMGGNLIVRGDLSVQGETTFVNEEIIVVQDSVIQLAVPESGPPSDLVADGGGIILKGTTDHSILWDLDSAAWVSSENIDLLAGKEYRIAGATVLTSTGLGISITAAPGLTQVGELEELTVDNITVNGNTIASTSGDIVVESAENVDVSESKLINLADPDDDQDAATKIYVDNTVKLKPILLSVDLTDEDTADHVYIITNILNLMAPVSENVEGTEARILCSSVQHRVEPTDINSLVVTETETFSKPSGTGDAVTSISVETDADPGDPDRPIITTVTSVRWIKIFRIFEMAWEYIEDREIPTP